MGDYLEFLTTYLRCVASNLKKKQLSLTRVALNCHTCKTNKPMALEFKSEFKEGGKTGVLRENPRSKDENQQQTRHTYDTESKNRSQSTLVGRNHSHHCTIPAPRKA